MNERGAAAEEAALRYLLARGMRLKARNYQCRLGEIDLIFDHDGTLVFVEVRQRRSSAFGGAAESITVRKRSKLMATARHYLSGSASMPPCRFDAILVNGDGTIEWIRDAFGE